MHIVGQNDDAAPMNIGILLPGQPEKPRVTLKLVGANGAEIKAEASASVERAPELAAEAATPKLVLPTPPEERKVLVTEGDTVEETSSMTWPHFVERRRFSCKPRVVDRAAMEEEGFREDLGDAYADGCYWSSLLREEQSADVAQATLEFVGEVGEMAEMVMCHGVKVFWGERRKKLIDECGDILFTGAWLIEAWCRNPYPISEVEEDPAAIPTLKALLDERPFPNILLGATDTELYRFEPEDIHAQIATVIISNGGMALMKNERFVATAASVLLQDASTALTHAAVLSNHAKKLIYQAKERDAKECVERVIAVFQATNFILCMANSSIEEAMIVNRAKIDARYKDGYFPGVNGGIRTEG